MHEHLNASDPLLRLYAQAMVEERPLEMIWREMSGKIIKMTVKPVGIAWAQGRPLFAVHLWPMLPDQPPALQQIPHASIIEVKKL